MGVPQGMNLNAMIDSPGDALAILSIVVILLGGVLYLIRAEIRSRTEQIQPWKNGGKSLPDLHKKLDQMHAGLLDELGYVRKRLDHHIDNHEREERR